MGILGIALTVLTGEIYRNMAFDNQKHAMEQLVELEIQDLLQDTLNHTTELGSSIQSSRVFKTAVSKREIGDIQHYLNEQFHRYFVTAAVVRLEKLIVFDKQMQLISLSTEGTQQINANNLPCRPVMEKAAKRRGAERLKLVSDICINEHHPYMAVILPIGGIRLEGYLMAVVDPTLNLAQAEKDLATPLKISLSSNDATMYISETWPEKISAREQLLSEYVLDDSQGRNIYKFTLASNITGLYKRLEKTRYWIIAGAILATIISALIALAVIRHTTIQPLSQLTRHLHRVREDKSNLGEPVVIEGNSEVRALADDFNIMSQELDGLYRELENMAFTDALTSLPNRALFYDRLEQATAMSKRRNYPFVLLMLDLNRFKNVNDTLGHHIGDELLKVIAERLLETVRETDTIARLGGDEFAAILTSANGQQAAANIANKIISLIKKPVFIDSHRLTVGTSIGIVCCPENGSDSNTLMQQADVAMYHAKHNNMGFSFYTKDLDQDNLHNLNLESDLYEAINKKQFQLYYQPKIDFNLGKVIGAEALLRWHHPQRGIIPPNEIIPLAENSGFIHDITAWVLENALKECAQWHQSQVKLNIAVNLSARSLDDYRILEQIQHALQASGLEPQYLSLEITENAVMHDADRALNLMERMANRHYQLSVDDFGTGYSSLSYLKRMPVTELKIDKSFVLDMDSSHSDEAIVHSTIDLAHNMGLRVTAEGVSNKNTLARLIDLGCDQAQGFYICQPLPAKEFRNWLFSSEWGVNNNAEQNKERNPDDLNTGAI